MSSQTRTMMTFDELTKILKKEYNSPFAVDEEFKPETYAHSDDTIAFLVDATALPSNRQYARFIVAAEDGNEDGEISITQIVKGMVKDGHLAAGLYLIY